ncbi:hypothetical protein V8E36_004995 [Tilletia maclaganii]
MCKAPLGLVALKGKKIHAQLTLPLPKVSAVGQRDSEPFQRRTPSVRSSAAVACPLPMGNTVSSKDAPGVPCEAGSPEFPRSPKFAPQGVGYGAAKLSQVVPQLRAELLRSSEKKWGGVRSNFGWYSKKSPEYGKIQDRAESEIERRAGIHVRHEARITRLYDDPIWSLSEQAESTQTHLQTAVSATGFATLWRISTYRPHHSSESCLVPRPRQRGLLLLHT